MAEKKKNVHSFGKGREHMEVCQKKKGDHRRTGAGWKRTLKEIQKKEERGKTQTRAGKKGEVIGEPKHAMCG